MIYWLLALFCIILTTFFSVAALVLRRVAWVKLEEIFELRRRPERTEFLRGHALELGVISSVFHLLANLGLLLCLIYAFSTPGPQFALQELPLVEAFLVSVLLLIIFSIVIPQTWAKYGGTNFLIRYYGLLWLVERICRPFARLFRFFTPAVRRVAGLAGEDEEEWIEERQEDLLNVVEESTNEGTVDAVERDMIESVLDFRNKTAGEIMTPRTEVVALEADLDISQAVEIIMDAGHSRFPVYEENIDRIIGMLYAKDLLRDLKAPDSAAKLRHRLRKPFFVPESRTVRDLLKDFQDHKVHLGVVLDEYGGTAGVVTFEDILEELVGDITDEYEPPQETPMVRVNANTIEADARVHVDDLNSEYELNIPESEDYETIGGFLFALLGHVPATGETVEDNHLRFTVLDAEQRKINRVRIERMPAPAPEK